MVNSSKPPVCTDRNVRGLKGKNLFRRRSRYFQPLLFFRSVFVAIVVSAFLLTPFFEARGQDRRSRRPTASNETKRQAAQPPHAQEIQDAIRNIPWDALTPSAKGKVKEVVSGHSIFRRLPQQKVYSDPEMYNFLVEHPDIVVAFWQKLGVTQILLREQKENRFWMKESTGTTAVAEVLYRTNDICIVHGRGQYLGPFLAKSYDGEVVIVLRSRFARDEDNEPFVVCDLDAFVRIDSIGADLFAKLFATSLGKIADSNFEQTVAFVSHVSEAASINPTSVRNLGLKLPGVREENREGFADVVDRVAMRSARRQGRTFPQYHVADGASQGGEEFAVFSMFGETPSAGPLDNPSAQNETAMTENTFYRSPPENLFPSQGTPGRLETPQTSAAVSGCDETFNALPIPIGFSRLGSDIPIAEPKLKGRAVFVTPKIARQTGEEPGSN